MYLPIVLLVNDIGLKDHFSRHSIPLTNHRVSIRPPSSRVGPRRIWEYVMHRIIEWLLCMVNKDSKINPLLNAMIQEKERQRKGLIDSLCSWTKVAFDSITHLLPFFFVIWSSLSTRRSTFPLWFRCCKLVYWYSAEDGGCSSNPDPTLRPSTLIHH